MTQVSKYPLSKDIEKKLFELLWEVVENLRNREEIERFLRELLTPTEEIMLAKRIAIAMMLVKKYDYRAISEALKVSTGTVARVGVWLRSGGSGYRQVLEKIMAKERWENFWGTLDQALAKAFPPYGQDWKEFYRKKAAARGLETPLGRVRRNQK